MKRILYQMCNTVYMSGSGWRNISLSSLLSCRNAEVKSRLSTCCFITEAVDITIRFMAACWRISFQIMWILFITMCNKMGLHYFLFIFEFLDYKPSCWYAFLTNVRHTFIYSMNFYIFYFSFLCISHLICLFLFRCEQNYMSMIIYLICYLM